MNYYRKMKDLREDNDLTQQDIANYLKITRGTKLFKNYSWNLFYI